MDKIAILKEMMEMQPDDAFLYHALGLEYCKMGEVKLAEEMFIKALEKSEDHVGTYYHLVNLLIKASKMEEAIASCERGLAACKRVGDQHAWKELNTLYEDLIY